MLDTIVYEVEYQDVHKVSLDVNTIAENIFSQVDEEGNRLVLFYDIVDNFAGLQRPFIRTPLFLREWSEDKEV